MLPNTESERTTMPRAIPRFFAIGRPGSSSAVVTFSGLIETFIVPFPLPTLDDLAAPRADRRRQQAQPVADDVAVGHARLAADFDLQHVAGHVDPRRTQQMRHAAREAIAEQDRAAQYHRALAQRGREQ